MKTERNNLIYEVQIHSFMTEVSRNILKMGCLKPNTKFPEFEELSELLSNNFEPLLTTPS